MEAGPAETRAQKAAQIRPELFRLLLEFDPPEEERTAAEVLLVQAKSALQRQLEAEQAAAAEAEWLMRAQEETWVEERAEADYLLMEAKHASQRRRLAEGEEAVEEVLAEEAAQQRRRMEENYGEVLHAYDRRPLRGSRFQDCCRTTRDGCGLPEGPGIPAGITHDLVLQFDLPARRMEREERLPAMHNGDLNATLLDICCEGGGKDVRFLLVHGADANYQDGFGCPLLKRAAENGHLAVVEALLDAGADELGEAFGEAALYGHTDVVVRLLDRGADIHHYDDVALNNAAFNDELETATLLLDRGADPNAVNEQFGTPLAVAKREGSHAVAALLLAHGAIDESEDDE